MKRVLQTSALLSVLLGLSSGVHAAKSTEQFETGPRCTPYPECVLGVTSAEQSTRSDSLVGNSSVAELSSIYRFDLITLS